MDYDNLLDLNGVTRAVNLTFVPPTLRPINRPDNEPFVAFFVIYFLRRITSSGTSGSELWVYPGCAEFAGKYGSMSHAGNCLWN